jgi:hypothetical protein
LEATEAQADQITKKNAHKEEAKTIEFAASDLRVETKQAPRI